LPIVDPRTRVQSYSTAAAQVPEQRDASRSPKSAEVQQPAATAEEAVRDAVGDLGQPGAKQGRVGVALEGPWRSLKGRNLWEGLVRGRKHLQSIGEQKNCRQRGTSKQRQGKVAKGQEVRSLSGR